MKRYKAFLIALLWLVVGLNVLLTGSADSFNYACVWIVLLCYLFIDALKSLTNDENL